MEEIRTGHEAKKTHVTGFFRPYIPDLCIKFGIYGIKITKNLLYMHILSKIIPTFASLKE